MHVRPAQESEIEYLASLWHDGWQDAHAGRLPPELARDRTLDSFAPRLRAALERVRVAGPVGAPVGFHIVQHDELYQLYVSAQARGTGTAAALLADAESQMSRAGVHVSWLACAIGNDRAARFYEKCGWRRAGIVTARQMTSSGEVAFDVWRYEKTLSA